MSVFDRIDDVVARLRDAELQMQHMGSALEEMNTRLVALEAAANARTQSAADVRPKQAVRTTGGPTISK